MRECPKNNKVVETRATDPNLHQLLNLNGLHLEELLQVLVEGPTTCMQSLAAKRKRILLMFPLDDQNNYF